MTRGLVLATLMLAAVLAWPMEAVANHAAGHVDSIGAWTESNGFTGTASTMNSGGGSGGAASTAVPVVHGEREPNEWLSTLGCGDTSNPDRNSSAEACLAASEACTSATGEPGILYYAWSRPAGTNRPWSWQGQTCSVSDLPASPPPPVPTMADIQTAFVSLPFGKPIVSIQPVGGTTLVNLPTYYEIVWDGSGLAPGQISAPVQLLAWSVEFQPMAFAYDVDFGDGTTSGPTTDLGGPYPTGGIRHTYTQPLPASQVSAQTILTGRFRINGGDWIDIATTAALDNEPVTVLRVAEARARLYKN